MIDGSARIVPKKAEVVRPGAWSPIAADGSGQGQSPRLDPTRRVVDLYLHETSKRRQIVATKDGRTTTVRLHGPRPALLLELDGAAAFLAGGAVVLPRSSNRETELGALELAALVLVHARHAGPDVRWLVAGHGPDDEAGALTRARARSLHRLLTGDAAGWADDAARLARPADEREVLAWAAEVHGWPCHPSAPDALAGLRRSLGLLGRAPGDGPALQAADWLAVFDLCSLTLARGLGTSLDDLAARRGALPMLEPVGCGAAWPPDRVRMHAHELTLAERLDVLCFAAAQTPELACHADGGCDWKACDLYRKGKYRARDLEATTWVEVELTPDGDEPVDLAGVGYQLVLPGGARRNGVFDASGRLRIDELPAPGGPVLVRLLLEPPLVVAPPVTIVEDDRWVEVVLDATDGLDPREVEYEVLLPDGRRNAGKFDETGRVWIDGLTERGDVQVRVRLPDGATVHLPLAAPGPRPEGGGAAALALEATDFVEVVLEPQDGVDPAGIAWEVVLPGGGRRAGVFDADGRARIEGVTEHGDVVVRLSTGDDLLVPVAGAR